MGMICALEFAYQNKLLKHQELMMVKKHYRELNLQSDIKKYFKRKDINKIIKYSFMYLFVKIIPYYYTNWS